MAHERRPVIDITTAVVGVHKIVAVNERKRTVLLRFMNAAVHEQKNQTGRVLNELNEHS